MICIQYKYITHAFIQRGGLKGNSFPETFCFMPNYAEVVVVEGYVELLTDRCRPEWGSSRKEQT